MKLSIFILGGGLIASTSAFQPTSTSTSTLPVRARARTLPLTRPVSSLSAYVDVSESASRDVGAMDEWASNCGVQRVEGVQLTSDDGLDWSVATTSDLPSGNPILYIPSEMILSSSRVQQELGGAIESSLGQLGRLDDSDQISKFYLFIKVLMEYESGDQSPYFPWLNSLPRGFYNGPSMTHACYECLPPLVSSLSMNERVRFINFRSALKSVDFLSEETKSNSELAKWAFNVVFTRCFGPVGDKRIIPWADMFNHGSETEIDFSYDDDGNCSVYTTTDVPAGSPLRMSYGDPTNPSYLFARYGFVDETAQATFCKIMITKPNKELLDLGYDFSRMLFYKDTGGVSEEVWDVLLYQSLTFDKDAQRAFYEAHANGDADTKAAYHQHYFGQTSSALKLHVDTFLSELDKLTAKAANKNPTENPRIPIINQHNSFVRTTFLAVKEQIDQLVVDQ